MPLVRCALERAPPNRVGTLQAWPIGVTSIGIHDRSAREALSSHRNVQSQAHIMNDEVRNRAVIRFVVSFLISGSCCKIISFCAWSCCSALIACPAAWSCRNHRT
jgi:Prp18 domain